MTERGELDALRTQARRLIRALDSMHERGETFTPRVSIATAELRRLLVPTWPTDESDGVKSSPFT